MVCLIDNPPWFTKYCYDSCPKGPEEFNGGRGWIWENCAGTCFARFLRSLRSGWADLKYGSQFLKPRLTQKFCSMPEKGIEFLGLVFRSRKGEDSVVGKATVVALSVLTVLTLFAGMSFAQGEKAEEPVPGPAGGEWARPLLVFGAAIGSGLIIAGAAYAISRVGASAVESMARQPEASGNIQTAMLIAAALIEGVTFFALIVLLIAVFRV